MVDGNEGNGFRWRFIIVLIHRITDDAKFIFLCFHFVCCTLLRGANR